ncbi:MAG: hypothetical protein ACRDBL_12825 [Rhabdaerophilum sp.]
MLNDPERFSPALAREAFRLVLGRDIPPDHLAALCQSKPNAPTLLRQLILSDEFQTSQASRLGLSLQEIEVGNDRAQLSEATLISLFRTLIGHCPNEIERQIYFQPGMTETEQLSKLLHSEAFCGGRGVEVGPIPYVTALDLTVIRSVPLVESEPIPGMVIDGFGTKTAFQFSNNETIARFGVVEGYPIPKGNHQGGTEEWFGCIVAAHETGPVFKGVQIGGQRAEWLVSAVRAAKNFRAEDYLLHFVGSDSSSIAVAEAHIHLNALEKDRVVLHDATSFSAVDDAQRNMLIETWFSDRLAKDTSEKDDLDFVVLDWPGHEYEIVSKASKRLEQDAKCLVVRTGSREAEFKIMDHLSQAGWLLWRERPCRLAVINGVIQTESPGAQVWRNSQFFSRQS